MSKVFDREKLERVVAIFQERLFDASGERVREYLSVDRRWDVERLRAYEVGYCPPDVPYPVRGQPVVEGRMWAMRGRMVVPIRDEFGEIIALAGRKLDWCEYPLRQSLLEEYGSDRMESMMDKWNAGKWINEMYQKKHHLYRLFDCRRSLAGLTHAILVEGYMDAIALADAGFTNTVCLSGTKMTFWHVQALRRYGVEHLVLCLDGDTAGIEAAWKSEASFDQQDMGSSCQVVLPDGLDPDEAVIDPVHGPAFRWALMTAATRRGQDDKRIIAVDSVATRLAARNHNDTTHGGRTSDQD